MSREEQFDFYWKEIFDGLPYNPIEFNVYRFDQSMSLPSKFNKLYEMFKQLALNNQEVVDYLKEFMETFDFKLETTIKDILIVWLNEGLLADVVREAINEEVIEARTDYLGKNYVDLKERLDSEKAESLTKANEIEADIEEVTTQLAQIAIDLKTFGAKYDGVYDDALALQQAINTVPEGTTLFVPYSKKLHIKSTVKVTKNINLKIYGEVIIETLNITAFEMGDLTHPINYNDWHIQKVTGKGRQSGQVVLELKNCSYNDFNLRHVMSVGKIILNDPISKDVGCGENSWSFLRWQEYDIAVHFKGASSWEQAPWAEGNQFNGGFMVRGNVGILVDENIKAGAMTVICAIDNMEVTGGRDFVNNANLSKYSTGNLLLMRFYRNSASVFKINDTRIEPNTGMHVNGTLSTSGNLQIKNNDGTTGIDLLQNGQIEMSGPTPFIDMKDDKSKDRDIRISLSNGDISLSASQSGEQSNGFKVKKNGPSYQVSGVNVPITDGSSEVTINLPFPQPDNDYAIFPSLNWDSGYYIGVKSVNGFVVRFKTPAVATSKMDWFLIRK